MAPAQENTKPRVPLRKLVGVTARAVRLVWQSSRREAITVFVLQALSGLILPAQVLAGTLALNSIQKAIDEPGAGLSSTIPRIGLFLAIFAAGRFLSTVSQLRQRLLSELVTRNMQERLAEKAASLDLEHFETPSFYDRLTRAQRESYRPMGMVFSLTGMTSSAVTIVAFMAILLRIDPVVAAIVLAAYVPMWLSNVGSSRAMYRFIWGRTPGERQMGYITSLVTGQPAAKEIRMFGLGRYLLSAYRRLFEERLAELRKVLRRRMVRSLLAALGATLLIAGGIFLVLSFYSSGRITLLESFSALAAILLAGQRLTGIIASAGQLYESAMFVDDYWSFLEIPASVVSSPQARPVPARFDKLTTHDLSFTYPDSAHRTLSGVSIEIGAGEVIALVGENGAGKTTLAKLLCRLYDPQEGSVRWDGQDIRTFDLDQYRDRIAVIFQDFAQYRLSARENIGFGSVARVDEVEKIVEAARHSGADEFLSKLPEGYESMLGKLFDQGNELSIGQWQKVALARAFFRDAPLVIMDEPTASLDARAEYALFQTMRTLFQGRSVLLISHRFSSVRMADRIYVLKDGEVIEHGNHEQLMAIDGLYAELFTLQASAYLDGRTSAELQGRGPVGTGSGEGSGGAGASP